MDDKVGITFSFIFKLSVFVQRNSWSSISSILKSWYHQFLFCFCFYSLRIGGMQIQIDAIYYRNIFSPWNVQLDYINRNDYIFNLDFILSSFSINKCTLYWKPSVERKDICMSGKRYVGNWSKVEVYEKGIVYLLSFSWIWSFH